MEIAIKIPKEFENHFNSDKFEDSLQRVRFDIHKAIISGKDVLSGNYEIETLDMLTEAFLNGTPLPKEHGRLIDADAVDTRYSDPEVGETLDDAPTIIEADKDGGTEWINQYLSK